MGDGECSSVLEFVAKTKNVAEERRELLLNRLQEDEKDIVGYEIEKWPVNEAGNLFHERKVE